MKKSIIIAAIGILWVIVPQTQAALIEIAITAEVTDVDDPGNLLEGNVNVGDTITGSYKYDSDTPDSSPLDPVQGNYWHYLTPFGAHLNVGGFDFISDPDDIEFGINIRDNNTSGNDIYGFISYNNSLLSNGTPVASFFWQLNDDTATALNSDSLPLIAPELEKWQYENRLFIEGGERAGDFKIIGEVTSAILIPEPTSIILFTLGFLSISRKNRNIKR